MGRCFLRAEGPLRPARRRKTDAQKEQQGCAARCARHDREPVYSQRLTLPAAPVDLAPGEVLASPTTRLPSFSVDVMRISRQSRLHIPAEPMRIFHSVDGRESRNVVTEMSSLRLSITSAAQEALQVCQSTKFDSMYLALFGMRPSMRPSSAAAVLELADARCAFHRDTHHD